METEGDPVGGGVVVCWEGDLEVPSVWSLLAGGSEVDFSCTFLFCWMCSDR